MQIRRIYIRCAPAERLESIFFFLVWEKRQQTFRLLTFHLSVLLLSLSLLYALHPEPWNFQDCWLSSSFFYKASLTTSLQIQINIYVSARIVCASESSDLRKSRIKTAVYNNTQYIIFILDYNNLVRHKLFEIYPSKSFHWFTINQITTQQM
jgi:hypothetical protein